MVLMAWLTDWKYRKPITLSRASGAVTNYQMKLLVGESAGATGEDVDCGGKCLSTFNDLRFTAADGFTLLDYWVESLSGTTPNQLATVWVEFGSIGTGATQFYMYYGNAGASSCSNGANTFLFFDDFERGSDGDTIGGNWTETVAHVHISTEQKFGGAKGAKFIGMVGSRATATFPFTAGDNYAIQCRVYHCITADLFATLQHGNNTNRLMVAIEGVANKIQYYNGSWTDTGSTATPNAWSLFEVNNINFTAGTFDIYLNQSLIKSAATMHASNVLENIVKAYGAATVGQEVWVDNYIIRNWRSTEPAWGSWGSEEEYRAFKSMLILTGSGWREARGI
jgi:hypothetical protein